ncbi:helix-turn-helix domain-containing protein [Agrobacterium sp. rho-13.3]|uniref:helix-turn-helix domain-containing protein n=1 Tax=Agrobacterium sp. rho-13.3 TaxID=3072980 RepID=UPI002A145EC0|nr:helix-turn-helix transcriptional regulator [Agrobacterium sp. rho-13.3]MDX8310053.1 helix-turn-helix transcriptional regulator [Agrobacterium sp. rho-13.3]
MSKPKKWTKPEIKKQLEERGMTLTGLAEMNGLNPNTFRAVWSRTVRPAERALANFLGAKVEELFPDRYPIRKTRILDSAKYPSLESQNSNAAVDKLVAA